MRTVELAASIRILTVSHKEPKDLHTRYWFTTPHIFLKKATTFYSRVVFLWTCWRFFDCPMFVMEIGRPHWTDGRQLTPLASTRWYVWGCLDLLKRLPFSLSNKQLGNMWAIGMSLGPQNHEKWRFYTPNIWVITRKNEGCGFPWVSLFQPSKTQI